MSNEMVAHLSNNRKKNQITPSLSRPQPAHISFRIALLFEASITPVEACTTSLKQDPESDGKSSPGSRDSTPVDGRVRRKVDLHILQPLIAVPYLCSFL